MSEASEKLEERGFVLRREVLSTSACERLCKRLSETIAAAAERARSERAEPPPDWVLLPRSSAGVEVFWNPRLPLPFDRPAVEWERRAVRVGHALHRELEWSEACRATGIAEVVREVLPGPARIVSSAVIYKNPGDGFVAFALHQDSWYLPSEPETLLGAFVALDATDLENGCLQLVPESHRAPLGCRLALRPDGWRSVGPVLPAPDASRLQPVPMGRGDALLFHGRTYHASDENRSGTPRRALIVHYLGAGSSLTSGSWLKEPEGGFPSLDA